jgi:hypothetical protein
VVLGQISFNGVYTDAGVSGIAGGAADLYYNVPTAGHHFYRVNNVTVLDTTSTGLAVTGTLSATATIRPGGYTVATLPSGTVGMKTYVTDALAPAFLVLLASGGSAYSGAQYNGTQWVGD